MKLVELGEERYIVCLNEEEAKRDQAVREEIVSELREKIAKGPKKMIGNTGYRRYLSVGKNAVQIDEKKIASEKKFDGIYVLRTNTDLSAKEAALAYKGLWQVERAFREIKTTFEIRPVYLSPGRIGSRDTSPSASWHSAFRWHSFGSYERRRS